MNLKQDVLQALLKTLTNKNLSSYELNKDLNENFLKYLASLHKEKSLQTEQPLTYEDDEVITYDWLKREPVLKVIFETLVANLIPIGLNDHYYRVDGQLLDLNKLNIIQNILDNINFDKIVYDIITLLIIHGQVGVMILDLTDIHKLFDAINKNGFMPYKENYSIEEEIKLERDLSYIKTLKDNLSTNNKKSFIVDYSNEQLAYIKLAVVHKSRIIPIRFAHFTLGYLIAGNPYTDDLSKSMHKTEPVIKNDPYHTKVNTNMNKDEILMQIKDYIKKQNIAVDDELLKRVEEKIINNMVITFVPASHFELISLPDIYEKGLINIFVPFVTSLAILRNALVQQLIKAQDLVLVKVDISNLTKAYVGEYIQNIINQFKNKMYAVNDDKIPVSALPNMITPLNVLFIPTYGGNATMEINVEQIPFQQDIINIFDAIMQNLSKQLGMSPAILNMDTPDQTSLAQVNYTLFNKLCMIQDLVAKHLTNLVYKVLKQINKELYSLYYGLFEINFNKSYYLIFNALNDIVNIFSTLAQNMHEYPELKVLLEKVIGSEFTKLFETESLISKYNQVKQDTLKSMQITNNNNANDLLGTDEENNDNETQLFNM